MKAVKEPQAHKKPVITLANQITILRLILIPVIFICLIEDKMNIALGILLFCVFTDFLDGMVARLRGEQTRLGAFLDPMADKFLLTSVYLALMNMDLIPTWMFVVIFSRDLLIVLGWLVIYILTGNAHIQPRLLGKITTTVQMITAVLCIFNSPNLLPTFVTWGMIAMTVVSAIDYIIEAEKRLGAWN